MKTVCRVEEMRFRRHEGSTHTRLSLGGDRAGNGFRVPRWDLDPVSEATSEEIGMTAAESPEKPSVLGTFPV